MLAGSRLRLALVLFGGLVLQTAVVPHFAVAGRIVDVMLLLAVCAGMLAGPERGATVGFFAGVGTDLIVQTPFGMWALAATLTLRARCVLGSYKLCGIRRTIGAARPGAILPR